MKSLVSLIVPCYNGERYLQSFLDCVLSQSYRPLELIFVDDGSEDGTAMIIEENRLRFIESEISLTYKKIEHQGQSYAMNAGLKIAKGEYLAWCDADDFLLSDNIKSKADFLTRNKDYGMVRNDAWDYSECEKILKRRVSNTSSEDIFEGVFRETLYCYAGCYMVRMSLLEECYPDRELPNSKEGQNLQLLLPPLSRTRCGYIDKPLMIYRIHENSHAHRQRTLQEAVERAKSFVALKKKLLDYSIVEDRAYYERLAEEPLENLKKDLFLRARQQKEVRK